MDFTQESLRLFFYIRVKQGNSDVAIFKVCKASQELLHRLYRREPVLVLQLQFFQLRDRSDECVHAIVFSCIHAKLRAMSQVRKQSLRRIGLCHRTPPASQIRATFLLWRFEV